ncbi:GrpB family protein [Bacillus sp. MUM 13]|uniref:GrpB family protein n=1 Tax=Bacillus sp. MUM 13 TaxID=1678001 RepID=UPI0008F5CAAD|nr:GrpB family protein [Bacillus sp. MUM 13]OIK09241.1 hypothetical protein BIV59_17440 [Bacillus sp. MUM 13]
MPKPIVNLSDYDPKWGKQFEYEQKRILKVLGDKAFGIEHIGSTSIKGLEAKPIIDIIVGVQDLDEISNFVSPLSEIEYASLKKELASKYRFDY